MEFKKRQGPFRGDIGNWQQTTMLKICGPLKACRKLNLHSPDGEPSMLVVMQSLASDEQIREVCKRIESLGLKAHPTPGSIRTAIGITGNKGAVDLGVLESMPGVGERIPVSKPYKLVSRDAKEETPSFEFPRLPVTLSLAGIRLRSSPAVRGRNRGLVLRRPSEPAAFIDWITSSAPLDRVDLAKVIRPRLGGKEPSDAYYRL